MPIPKILYIIVIIILNILSAVLSILAQNDKVFSELIEASVLNENIDIEGIQLICLCISTIWSVVVVNAIITKNTYTINEKTKQVQHFTESFRNDLDERIKDIIQYDANINIRIFVGRNFLKRFLFARVDSKTLGKVFTYHFSVKNVLGLSSVGTTEKLSFCVAKRVEGLVGQAYDTGGMMFDYKLKNTNEKNYSLNKYQIDKTRNLTFSVCVPIANSSGRVIAVVAYDSTNNVSISATQREKLNNIFISNAIVLYKTIPELFK